MFKNWGWYIAAVFLAIVAAFWTTTARAHETRTQISIYSTPGPAHNSAPRFHHGPNSHPPHQHRPHGHMHHPRPPVYYQPPPPVYYAPPAQRYYQTCQRWDGWRQQYIYVPC